MSHKPVGRGAFKKDKPDSGNKADNTWTENEYFDIEEDDDKVSAPLVPKSNSRNKLRKRPLSSMDKHKRESLFVGNEVLNFQAEDTRSELYCAAKISLQDVNVVAQCFEVNLFLSFLLFIESYIIYLIQSPIHRYVCL